MKNIYKKVANENFEEVGAATTRSTSRHGLSKAARKLKKLINRAAKRIEARLAAKENDNACN